MDTNCRAVPSGGDVLVFKDRLGEALISAVARVIRGGNALGLDVIDHVFAVQSDASRNTPAMLDLTARDRDMLGEVTQVLANLEIACKPLPTDRSVRNTMSVMLGKPRLRNRSQVAGYAATFNVAIGGRS